MHKVLFIYKGTIGSILACYIKRLYDVMVLEYELDASGILSETALTDVALALIVGQELPDDAFQAIRKQGGNAAIVWLCQDRNNKDIPDASVEKFIFDGTDEWIEFNDVLEKYLKPFHKNIII